MKSLWVVSLLALVLAVAALVGWFSLQASMDKWGRGVAANLTSLEGKIANISASVDKLVNATRGLEERVSKLEAKKAAEKEIVVVPVDFAIYDYEVDFLVKYVKRLEFDDRVAGVVLLINSPGGAVGATERLYSTIAGLNKTKYAVIAGLGASGAYYTAVAAERIYATPSSWVGSVGVIAFIAPEDYLAEVPDWIYTTGPWKYYGKDLLALYDDVEKVRENFVNAVLKGRGDRLKDLKAVETAEIFRADEALRIGLIDAIGGLWDAVRDMAKELGLKNYTVVDIYEKYNATRYTGIVIPLLGGKIDAKTLLKLSPEPIFYIYPGAVQFDGFPNATVPPVQAAVEERRGVPYVVLDMSHGNAVPPPLLEPLAAELVPRGYGIRVANSESELVKLLDNATGLIVVNPMQPFGEEALLAVVNATRRGVRVLYMVDVKSPVFLSYAFIIVVSSYNAPLYVHNLLAYFNATVVHRAVYNDTAVGARTFTENWQFLHVTDFPNSTLFRGVRRLVLFGATPASTRAQCRVDVRGAVRGYGPGNYTVAFAVGNFTYVGSVRSFTPYFIQLGDNKKFFSNLVEWLVEPRPIAPPPKKAETTPTYPYYPVPIPPVK